MENINKFIGIPHYFGESSFEKCDCIGLCRLFYKEHGWNYDFTDYGDAITEGNYSSFAVWKRLFKYLKKNFEEIPCNELRFGDFVLFEIDGCLHTGIYMEYGKLLCMQVPVVYGITKSTVYKRNWWMPFFKHGYRRKGQEIDG